MNGLSWLKSMVKPMHMLLLIVVVAAVAAGLLVWSTLIRVRTATSSAELRRIEDISQEAWGRLSEKTVFFGHRSVGNNIVDGIRDLIAQRKVPNLNVVETKDPEKVVGPMLAHGLVGHNLKPETKIAEFKKVMEGGLAEKVDIAFFKFCYVDIGINSDLDAILTGYCQAMEALQAQFPEVLFVHVTVPLGGRPRAAKAVLKASIKRAIGRPPVLRENEVRSRYNEMLRERFSEKEPLFDLALYETLGPEGQRCYALRNGQEVPVLAGEYTDDGGHLNATGRQHVAEQLLIELLNLANRSQ